MQNTLITHKRTYDWLKQYQFQQGNKAAVGAKHKGKKMKTFLAEMFMKMSDEEKARYAMKLDAEIALRLAEGNPHSTADVVTRNISEVLNELEDGNKAIRQSLANGQSLPIEGQTKTVDSVPAQSSAEPLQSTQVVEKYNPQEPSAGLHD